VHINRGRGHIPSISIQTARCRDDAAAVQKNLPPRRKKTAYPARQPQFIFIAREVDKLPVKGY
jgi:hypothetical protein